MSPSGIVVTGVRRSFGAVHAVRDVSFDARAGAVTGLVVAAFALVRTSPREAIRGLETAAALVDAEGATV